MNDNLTINDTRQEASDDFFKDTEWTNDVQTDVANAPVINTDYPFSIEVTTANNSDESVQVLPEISGKLAYTIKNLSISAK